jgi:hypothetical protein
LMTHTPIYSPPMEARAQACMYSLFEVCRKRFIHLRFHLCMEAIAVRRPARKYTIGSGRHRRVDIVDIYIYIFMYIYIYSERERVASHLQLLEGIKVLRAGLVLWLWFGLGLLRHCLLSIRRHLAKQRLRDGGIPR